ncbi:MAG TPA: glycosyltransferase family 39 protein [Thermoanaerobaculia bacterium]|nr:glycosyltransferase family 39 protein [Thermoanaerobaculia bacterium]
MIDSRPEPSAAAAAWTLPLVLGLGLALRAAMSFPTHDYQGNADEVLNALCAFRIMRGEHPVFYVAERLGALQGYVTALLFWLFGASRNAMAAEPVLSGALMLGAWYLFLREALGRRLALIALPFAAFPSPAFLHWTAMPNSYPSTLFLDAASLWLAARLARGDRSRWTVTGFGLFAGLAWWASPLSLGCTLPALLWVAWRRRDLRQWRAAGRFAAGCVLGALPWLVYNVRHPLASLRQTPLLGPVSRWEGLLDNARFLATVTLRELIASVSYESHPRAVTHALQKPVLVIVGLAALASLVIFPLRRFLRRRQGAEPRTADPAASAVPLLSLTVIVVVLLNIVSAAGSDRGLPVRYLLPLYLVIPAVIAIALGVLASRSRAAAAACAATIVVFNLAGACLPGTAARHDLEADARQDDQLLDFLRSQRVGALAGSYWKVYPIGFLSRERILAIPMEEGHDHYRMADRLPASPLRWALVAQKAEDLRAWASHAGLSGAVQRVTPAAAVFLPHPNPPGCAPAAFQLRLKAAYSQAPAP